MNVDVRVWWYVEPGDDGVTAVERYVSDEEILTTYYPWWVSQMQKVGKLLMATPATCLEDWAVVHWAEKGD